MKQNVIKKCSTCGIVKAVNDFYKGQYYTCKSCINKRKKEYARTHTDHISAQKKKYYKEVIIERRNKARELKYGTPEQRAELKLISKVKADQNRKKYYQDNKEKLNARAREYAKNNRAEINRKLKEKISTDPQFRMASKLRTLLYVTIRSQSAKKHNHTFQLIGCTPAEFKTYIESLFLPGMTWDNNTRHGWHLDHKIPCSEFNLTKEDEQYKCFHYTNFQPLWAVDNIKKSNNI